MTVMLETTNSTTYRDPRSVLNAVRPHVKECTYNVLGSRGSVGLDIWDREIALLLRDNVMVRDMAERVLGNAVAYLVTAMEHPNVHIGVGKVVDIGVHQIILDTPVYFAFCDLYNGGRYKHHAPLIERRGDGLVIRTAEFIRSNGFDADEELWAIDGANCSPCDNKAPDSH
ncbi:hypothetical protein [Streptomyces buecherae]|uniref:Uncharacterized protein n=1 Tax=Streptomyces buecherae TaxID=2763006 RepID=A0A7H8N535_9ACTN|nr:hypothetical protein [Streptomyces buecherae]QKW49624.1 hypothetical protein HUT08_08740 [Streptomyces buecherae]